jgi:hypothetical protein
MLYTGETAASLSSKCVVHEDYINSICNGEPYLINEDISKALCEVFGIREIVFILVIMEDVNDGYAVISIG